MSKITNLTASVAVLSASLVFATAANAIEIYEPSAQNEAFVACFDEKPDISSEKINQRISEVMQQKMANGEGLSGLLSDTMNSFYKQSQIDAPNKQVWMLRKWKPKWQKQSGAMPKVFKMVRVRAWSSFSDLLFANL